MTEPPQAPAPPAPPASAGELDHDVGLVEHDALASAAYATMLERIGVLRVEELPPVLAELRQIAAEARAGTFRAAGHADVHAAIESRLLEYLGDLGHRVDAGRGHRERAQVAFRLWARQALLDQVEGLLGIADELLELAAEHDETRLPRRARWRRLPARLGWLFAGHAESLLDGVPWLQTAHAHLNRSPLGSGGGQGGAPLDRQLASDLLAFDRPQGSALLLGEQGKTETLVLAAGCGVALDLARLAGDLAAASEPDLAILRLDARGSAFSGRSDPLAALDLARAGAGGLRRRLARIGSLWEAAPCGDPAAARESGRQLVGGMRDLLEILAAVRAVVAGLEVDPDRCLEGAAAAPVGTDPRRSASPPAAAGTLDLAPCRARLAEAHAWLKRRSALVERTWKLLEPERR